MLPTPFLQERISKAPEGSDIVFDRLKGVVKKYIIPANMITDTQVYMRASVKDAEKAVRVEDGYSLGTVTDEIGLCGSTHIEIIFIDRDTMAFTLSEGMVFLKNGHGVPYGFNDSGNLIKADKATVRWIKVSKLYELALDRISYVFNVAGEMAEDYVFNSLLAMQMTFKKNAPSLVKKEGYYAETYRITSIFDSICLGEFALTKFEREEAPEKVSYLDTYSHSAKKEKDFDDMTLEEVFAYEKKLEEERLAEDEDRMFDSAFGDEDEDSYYEEDEYDSELSDLFDEYDDDDDDDF